MIESKNDASKNLKKTLQALEKASTRFSIVKRSKGQSAVEIASYISRSVLVSEHDGQTPQIP